jgi:glutaredoxin
MAAMMAAVAALAVGCHSVSAGAAKDDAAVASAAPIVVRDDSQGLLLSWIDEKGDFHVEQKPADVPLVGRDAVRVVDPSRDGPHADVVYVADLRVPGPDGTYPVHTMSRDDFDALALARREKGSQPTLATPTAPAASAPSSGAGGAGEGDSPAGSAAAASAGRPSVIIYGARWCSACHQAMAYLKKKGVTFIEKDIEQDAQANSEMNSKLRRAGLRGGSIPVLDVRGRIMVGFEPHAVDQALGSPI